MSGSLTWRLSRGELGQDGAVAADQSFIITPTQSELDSKSLKLVYVSASDSYHRGGQVLQGLTRHFPLTFLRKFCLHFFPSCPFWTRFHFSIYIQPSELFIVSSRLFCTEWLFSSSLFFSQIFLCHQINLAKFRFDSLRLIDWLLIS